MEDWKVGLFSTPLIFQSASQTLSRVAFRSFSRDRQASTV